MNKIEKKKKPIRRSPATNPEDRENQLISMAMNAAEEQLRNGTASSQVITHFLKLGTTRERIEKEILEEQKELIAAKTEAVRSARKIEELYADAIKAFREYTGDQNDNV